MDFGTPEITTLDLDLLRCDTSILPREGIDRERRLLYEDLYREEGFGALPPVAVFFDGEAYWVADGFHRVYAAHGLVAEGKSITMPVALYHGTQRDAMVFACGANARHGKPLSSADKRLAIRRLLVDPETAQWSARRIGRYIGCDDKTVAAVKNELTTAEIPQSRWMGFTYGTTPAPAVTTPYRVTTTATVSPEDIRAVQPIRTPVSMVHATHRDKDGTHVIIAPSGVPVPAPAAPSPEASDSTEAPTPIPVKPPPSTPDAQEPERPKGMEFLHVGWRYSNRAAHRLFVAWAIKRLAAEDAEHAEDAERTPDTSETARNAAIIQRLFASAQDEASAVVHH
jgi:hypothetical protein